MSLVTLLKKGFYFFDIVAYLSYKRLFVNMFSLSAKKRRVKQIFFTVTDKLISE